MLDPKFLQILVCPETKKPVHLAPSEAVSGLNRLIAEGKVVNRAGAVVAQAVDGALVREDRAVLYPIRDDIPVMLIDEAIVVKPEMDF